MTRPQPFGAALLAHRRRLGLTQAGAAKLLGMPLRTWQDYERSRRVPPEWVQRLARTGIGRAWSCEGEY